ncbi:dienelactone hydrolase family protein [Asanoa sp. WMMD1127]|uniref:dienelactone hydrolase family protein n=1 Tax=Asanoa sp. WMMD1127 TaxID=3016107 RepID=UPI002415B4A4|nr:dienelactone hydrolase family protein [Asanoa sp. WMMD1127]MDG4823237.1 dienelactone hydrolase family protein [Asanoa sp. WMMD1127]
MATIALFHSVYGLRPAVLDAAERLRHAGHVVVAPDLYGGSVADALDEGFALSERIGWETIMRRARQALAGLPDATVLAGLSMGTGVVGDLLPDRRETAGLLLLHGIGADPAAARPGLPVHLHIADPDALFPPATVTGWRDALTDGGAAVWVHTYPAVGHLFTDPDTSDYDAPAADLAWRRSLDFLAALDGDGDGSAPR